MKYFILGLGMSMLFSSQVISQVAFGLKGGGNLSWLGIDGEKAKFGFYFGGCASFDFSKSMYLQPEVIYTARGVELPNYFVYGGPLSFDFHYFSLPVLMGVRVSEQLSLQWGPEFNFLASSKTNYAGQSITDSDPYTSFDPALTAGLEYNLTEQINLTLRYSHGFTQLIDLYFTDSNGLSLGRLSDGKTRSMQLGFSYRL